MRRLLSLALVAVLGAGCAAPSDDHGDRGGPLRLPQVPNADEGTLVSPRSVAVGTCLNDTDPLDAELRRRMLDCVSPHRFEVYATASLPVSAPPPDETQRVDESRALCEGRLAALLVGHPDLHRSDMVVAAFDDYVDGRREVRTVACAVAHRDLRQHLGNLLPMPDAPVG